MDKKNDFVDTFNEIKRSVESVSINNFLETSDFAFQFDIMGADSGTFYIQCARNDLIIEPYDFRDNTALIQASSETLFQLISGKARIDDIFRLGNIDIVGHKNGATKKVVQFFDACYYSHNTNIIDNSHPTSNGTVKNTSPWDKLRIYIENLDIDGESKNQLLANLVKFTRNELHILIVGACGCGKSSTINALFNMEIAQVGYGVDPETQDISVYKLDNLYLHDSPGLGESPSKDKEHIQKIKNAILEVDCNGKPIIDEVLVIIDGSHRDMRSSFDLINKVIIPNMREKERILVAINRCDLALDGRGWIKQYNFPDNELLKRLEEKSESVKKRIKDDTGVNVEPVFYSALHKYNVSKLLSYLVKSAPSKKRVFFAEKINNDASNFSRDDTKRLKKKDKRITDTNKNLWLQENVNNDNDSADTDEYEFIQTDKVSYQEEFKASMEEAFDIASTEISKGSKEKIKLSFVNLLDNVKQGAISGAEIGKTIGQAIPVIGATIGSAVGVVIGGVGGFISGLFQR